MLSEDFQSCFKTLVFSACDLVKLLHQYYQIYRLFTSVHSYCHSLLLAFVQTNKISEVCSF